MSFAVLPGGNPMKSSGVNRTVKSTHGKEKEEQEERSRRGGYRELSLRMLTMHEQQPPA